MQEVFSNKTIEKLKYDLVRDKIISYEELSHAEEISVKNNKHLGHILVEKNLISEENLIKFLETSLKIPAVNLDDYSLDLEVLDYIDKKNATTHKIIPLFKIENVLTIAMADPMDLFVLNSLIKSINCEIEPVICAERQIIEAINKFYGEEITFPTNENKDFDWKDELDFNTDSEFQTEKAINAIIYQAILEDVFEVIIENYTEKASVKFRKNREIKDKGIIPVLLSPFVIAKIKHNAGMDALQTGLPQLGKMQHSYNQENITCIISTFPLENGERVVLKLYKPPVSIENLSLSPEDTDYLKEKINSEGIILVTGPNLSGKSFVAYSILNSFDTINKNVMTIESIIKYNLNGVNQSELKEKVGFNLDKALQAVDFQTPDVLYVEEILTEKDIDFLNMLAGSNKTVITELYAESIEDLQRTLNKECFKKMRINVNCLIFVENKDKIHILK